MYELTETANILTGSL